MREPALVTQRLELVPCSPSVAIALVADVEEAERLLDARLPHEWPDPELAEFLLLYSSWLREDPQLLGWGVWLVAETERRTVVGSAGFQGRPGPDGEIELGYGIHADFRNQGYATEAAKTLLRWASEQPEVKRVIAHCDKDNIASQRVVEKAGMIRREVRANGRIRFETTA